MWFVVVFCFCFIYYSQLESSRTMSFSAPSAINMDQSTVKFDTEREFVVSDNDDDDDNESEPIAGSDESLRGHDWQSLSCLTDSTDRTVPISFDMSNRVSFYSSEGRKTNN